MESAGPERQIAGRYRLNHVIGRGGMGVVWQARDELLSRDVAVKELLWPACFSQEEKQAACRRATREAKVAARISHRNVVRVFDIIEEDGCPWIVMELLPPRSLRDLIQEEGALSPAQAAQVGLGILAALRAAHAEGIVHRDVKPANILLAADRVVLTDFGIARDGNSAFTTVGVLIGSPSYMAPERARGGRAGPPADLWGLGASLYAAVEGHGPFDRDGSALASLTAAVVDELEPAGHAGPRLWPVISGLLRKDPDERLNVAQAERMLRRVADPLARPPLVPPDIPVGAAGCPPRRYRVRAAALVGSAALAVLAVASTASMLEFTSSPGHQGAAAIAPPAAASTHSPAASTRTPAASTRTPAAGEHHQAPVGVHLTGRTSRAHAPRSSSASANAAEVDSQDQPALHVAGRGRRAHGKHKAASPPKAKHGHGKN